MSKLLEFNEEEYQEFYGIQEEGSWQHSLVLARLAALLTDERFLVAISLSLDTENKDLMQFGVKKSELKPDICIYSKQVRRPKRGEDVLKMTEMPLLIIEVLAPDEPLDALLAKFKAYFSLGVKTCWLVAPATEAVTVYKSINQFKTFGREQVLVDELTGLKLTLASLFVE